MGDNFAALGGNTAADEPAMAHVSQLITEVQGSDAMVTRFVLIVESIDADDRYISTFTSPGLKEWDSIGLLQWALDNEGCTVIYTDESDE